jgi:hypothetical protein
LADLIERDDGLTGALLLDDVDVAVQLNLTVNDTGGVSPSLTFINAPLFSFGLGGTVSQSREQNFTEKFYYSLRDLKKEADYVKTQNADLATCWRTDTNLAGELGIRRTVELAFTSQHVNWSQKLSDDGVFGGYVNFVVTKNVNGGPTWTLTNFTGPGSNLLSFSEINTDKLTFAFARGDKAGTPFSITGRQKADRLIEQITLNQLSTQLSGVRNALR